MDALAAQSLFLAAIALPPPERDRVLTERCAHDRRLRQLVDRLVECHEAAGAPLEAPAMGCGRGGIDTAPLQPGQRIGRFTIRHPLGSGGMGVVYLAQSERPRREVALKVVRPGLLTAAMLKRFEHEAQVLARLQHPGIAQIFEAGTTDGGSGLAQPFFAMELVIGRPLTDFAEARGLRAPERMELFARVCDAADHAHQNGVVHRDLKPANVLVTDDGRPKILDFGVARAAGSDAWSTTLATGPGQLIGTLSYMSPEQLAGDSSHVDRRSDVYALGVMLYELLTGRLPHEVAGKPLPEAARSITQDDPAPLGAVDRAFGGDVETIAAKALDKDPARRYASAADLAADIRRYLRDEPIAARPPSAGYQLRKFAKRNTALVGGAAAAFVALALGLVGTSWQAWAAGRQRDRAVEAELLAEERLTSLEDEAAIARDTVGVLQELLAAADPDIARGRDVTVAEVLEQAAARPPDSLARRPAVQAAYLYTIGFTYFCLGRYDEGEHRLQDAYDLRRSCLGDDHADTVRSRVALARVRGFTNLGAARQEARAALDQSRRVLGPYDRTSVEALTNLGTILTALGDHGASAVHAEALETALAGLGERDPLTLVLMGFRVNTLLASGRAGEAEALARRTLALHEEMLGPDHPDVFISQATLASALLALARPDEAEPLYRAALDGRRRVQGNAHSQTRSQVHTLASFHQMRAQYAQAEPLFRELLDTPGDADAPHGGRLGHLRQLAACLEGQDRLAESEPLRREALALAAETFGPADAQTARSSAELATLLRRRGRPNEALELFDQVFAAATPREPRWGKFRVEFGRCLLDTDQHERAVPELLTGLEDMSAALKPHDPRLLAAHADLARAYTALGRADEALHHTNAAAPGIPGQHP